ncbi:MAG: glycoside hydrolase, partial [Clostridia bacterium]|nr:glycoside hydrolase [Clostridia bacterium]
MIKKLIEDVSKNAITHGSLPFWSWNDKLEENELRRQIRNMHDLEMQGFFMHARGGLETEYMSDEWYDAINVCIDEARKLGMEAWSYDENGWPSGFAGGKLLEDPQNFARFLICKEQSEYPDGDVLAVY